jgi:hypothetical protein
MKTQIVKCFRKNIMMSDRIDIKDVECLRGTHAFWLLSEQQAVCDQVLCNGYGNESTSDMSRTKIWSKRNLRKTPESESSVILTYLTLICPFISGIRVIHVYVVEMKCLRFSEFPRLQERQLQSKWYIPKDNRLRHLILKLILFSPLAQAIRRSMQFFSSLWLHYYSPSVMITWRHTRNLMKNCETMTKESDLDLKRSPSMKRSRCS